MTGKRQTGTPRKTWILGAAIALAGCSTEVAYKAPIFPFGKNYVSARAGAPVLLSNTEWWKGLKDPTLNQLVEKALAGNLSLELAKERVTEARANVDSIAPLATATPNADAQRSRAPNGVYNTTASAALGLAWMLDPYGARRQQVNAARAQVEVADAEVDAARLLVLFNLANAYVDLRASQRILALRQQELKSRRQTVSLTRTLFDQGSATKLEVVSAEALVAETMAEIPTLKAAVGNSIHQIAVLTGQPPGRLGVDLTQSSGQPRARMPADVGIPADILRNRPDIRIAERLYYASVASIGVAKADLFPTLSVGGSIGLGRNAGTTGAEYFFGPAVRFPALPNGSQRAVVKARYSQARQAHTSWKSAVLEGILEVEQALLNYSASTSAVQSAGRAVRLYNEAADLTRDLLSSDGATIRDLIEAEQEIADANTVLAESLRQLGRNFVALHVSLGSGSDHGDVPVLSATAAKAIKSGAAPEG